MAHFIRGNIPTTPEEIARWLSTNQQTQSMHGLKLTISEGAISANNKPWTIIGQVKDQNSANVTGGFHVVRFWYHQKDHSVAGDYIGPVPSNATPLADVAKVYFGSLGASPTTLVRGAVTATNSNGLAWIKVYVHSSNLQDVGAKRMQSFYCYGQLQGGWGDVQRTTFVASNA